MSKTRILFLPPYFGFPSHFIPLVKLYQKLSQDQYDAAFLLPHLSPANIVALTAKGFNQSASYYYSREFLSSFELPVLDLDQQFSVFNELAAYAKFAPDVIIDDTNLTTALARQVRQVPRLTIVRSGVFADGATVSKYRHSLDSLINTLRPPPRFPFAMPSCIDEYFGAEAHIVPAAMSIEPMPCLPHDASKTFYSGPLILNEEEEHLFQSADLNRFINANFGRKVAYVTFGADSATSADPRVLDCLRVLLQRHFSIITNVRSSTEMTNLLGSSIPSDQYFFSTVLPMHLVCSRADLIVHVCGSGTYHYPILHGKATITIGTQSRDREIVAQILHARGLSYHVPAPSEINTFATEFTEAVNLYESASHPFDELLSERLARARQESMRTTELFNIDDAIDAALARTPRF